MTKIILNNNNNKLSRPHSRGIVMTRMCPWLFLCLGEQHNGVCVRACVWKTELWESLTLTCMISKMIYWIYCNWQTESWWEKTHLFKPDQVEILEILDIHMWLSWLNPREVKEHVNLIIHDEEHICPCVTKVLHINVYVVYL